MDLGLHHSVDQASGDGDQGRQEPQPPPQGPSFAPHQLVPAKTAVPVKGSGDSATAAALVQLQPAVRAASFLRVVEDHCGLVAPRAQAGGDECQWRKLHISVMTGITIGWRRVRL